MLLRLAVYVPHTAPEPLSYIICFPGNVNCFYDSSAFSKWWIFEGKRWIFAKMSTENSFLAAEEEEHECTRASPATSKGYYDAAGFGELKNDESNESLKGNSALVSVLK